MNEAVNSNDVNHKSTTINLTFIKTKYYFKCFSAPFLLIIGAIILFLWWLEQQEIIINGNRIITPFNWKWIGIILTIWSAPALIITLLFIIGLFRNERIKKKTNDDINTILNIEKNCRWILFGLWIYATFFILLIIWFIYRTKNRAIILNR